jgi:hypothetical protein
MSVEEEGTNPDVKGATYHEGLSSKAGKHTDDASGNTNHGDHEAIVTLQSFTRGALCRARVSLMVKKLIDDLLAERSSTLSDARVQSTRQSSTDNDGVSSAVGVVITKSSGPVPGDNESNGHARNEIVAGFGDLNPLIGESLHDASETANQQNTIQMENVDDLPKSVSAILSKFEPNSDHTTSPRVRHWSPAKGTKSPLQASMGKQLASSPKVPDAPFGPKSVKGKKIENNATRHVLSSEDIIHQHEVRLYESHRRKRLGPMI